MKYLDPFYWYLRMIHFQFLQGDLEQDEQEFANANINKHRLIQWTNLLATALVVVGLYDVAPKQMGNVITALLAPVMVMGCAWFAVSFGSIPAKLIHCSMAITFWMYLAFKVSLTTMFIVIGFITSPFLWPVLVLIYIAVDVSCAMYDTADGLKAGLDDALLRHSRAALLFYEKEGIDPEQTRK